LVRGLVAVVQHGPALVDAVEVPNWVGSHRVTAHDRVCLDVFDTRVGGEPASLLLGGGHREPLQRRAVDAVDLTAVARGDAVCGDLVRFLQSDYVFPRN
jgi:hypothetical protein